MVGRVARIFLITIITGRLCGQCANTCSSYVVSPYTYSLYEGGGTPLSLLDDEVSTTLPLGFVFDFFCQPYNQARVASNGFVTFDFGNIIFANTPYAQALPNSASPNAVIAWNWNDLDPSTATGGGSITYTTIGTSPNQQFIVTYSAVPLWTNASTPSTILNTGQIILNETTNLIEVHIGQARNNGWLTQTEGIEDHNGANGVAVMNPPRNLTLWQANNSSHIFAPYSVAATVTAMGPSTICPGSTGIYSATASPPPVSYNWFLPNGWIGTSTASTIAAIAGASGNVSVSANYTCGPSAPAAVAVNVTGAPVVSFASVSSTMLCTGYNATVAGNGATSFSLSPGGSTGSPSIVTTVTAPTVYTLSGTDNAGCVSLNNPTVFVNTIPSPTITVNSGTVCQYQTFQIIATGAFFYAYEGGSEFITPLSHGVFNYSVVGTGTNGCKSGSVVSTVSVIAAPPVVAAASRTQICKGESVSLSATGALTYTWNNPMGTGPTVTVAPFVLNTYTVSGTDATGCIGTSTVAVNVVTCTATGENRPAVNFHVFPNPFDREIAYTTDSDVFVKLVDITGAQLGAWSLAEGVGSLRIDVPPGIYFLTVSSESNETHRILVREP
jgi:hypothetical protein